MIVTNLFCAACLGGLLLLDISTGADRPVRAGRTPADAVNLTATATAMATAKNTDTPSASSDAADPFYDPRAVQTIHIEIKAEDLDRMQRALPKRITVPGAFRWNGITIKHVGIRYKGNSSSSPNSHHKRSFLISFSEFNKDQRFLGLRHAALDNAIQFGSVFSEPLITETLRELGTKASRCNYSRVHLNGQYAGVYVNVERIDRSFLERNFGAARGPLFKVDEGGPGADLRFLGDDPALYEQAFELHDGDRAKAYAGLLELIRTINDPTTTEAELRRRFDIDSFLTATAVLLFSGAFDQYTGWAPHNYYLHQNAIDGRWSYLPWDLDVGFADNAFGRVPVLRGWHAAWPAPVPGRPLMERVISNATLLEQYRRKATAILETHFQPARLIPKLRALHQQIKPDLDKDPFPPRRVTVPDDSSYSDIVDSIETFIRERYELARAQLDQPGQRPSYAPMEPARQDSGPKPGPPSTDAPTDLRLVKVTASRVEMRWTDHAEGEVAFVVQKCPGSRDTDFENAIGLAGANITTAVDPDVQPGKTYRYRVYAVRSTPLGPGGTGVSNIITVQVPAE
jgi:spore coat protein CotH